MGNGLLSRAALGGCGTSEHVLDRLDNWMRGKGQQSELLGRIMGD
jgi:hypothetical protein